MTRTTNALINGVPDPPGRASGLMLPPVHVIAGAIGVVS